MPKSNDASIEVVAFDWVPPFARGHVRDLRVRWALEEIGLPYRTRLVSARERPPAYFREQPFGQVPAFHEGDVHIFESGAIVLHIAEKDERLLPRDPAGRAETITWLISALNSVEPYVMNIVTIDTFCAGQDWAKLRRDDAVTLMERRLEQLADALGDKQWLTGRFSVADIIMIDVLRNLDPEALTIPAALTAYVARGTTRPAFKAALAAQLADFIPEEGDVTP